MVIKPTLTCNQQRNAIRCMAQLIDEIDAVRRQIVECDPSMDRIFQQRECQDVFIGLPHSVTVDDIEDAIFNETSVRVIGHRQDVTTVVLSYDGDGWDHLSYDSFMYMEEVGRTIHMSERWRARLSELLAACGLRYEDRNTYSLEVFED